MSGKFPTLRKEFLHADAEERMKKKLVNKEVNKFIKKNNK
jgi:hypothetical protein